MPYDGKEVAAGQLLSVLLAMAMPTALLVWVAVGA